MGQNRDCTVSIQLLSPFKGDYDNSVNLSHKQRDQLPAGSVH